MDYSQFYQLALTIVKSHDQTLRTNATENYFGFMKQFPDLYVQFITELFRQGDPDLKAFFAAVLRKHINQQGSKSALAMCQERGLVHKLLAQLLSSLTDAKGYSHILADLIGEIGAFIRRSGQDSTDIWEFLDREMNGPLEYEVSVVIWEFSSLQWKLLGGHFINIVSRVCEAEDYRVMSEAVLTLCNIMFMQLYANEEEDCIEFDVEEEIIGQIFDIVSRMCPGAGEHVSLFKAAMDQVIELFDCAGELFADHLDKIEQLSEGLILQFRDRFELESVGLSLFTAFITEPETFGLEGEDCQRYMWIIIQHFFPLLNRLSEQDVEGFYCNKDMDFNSPNYEVEFLVEQVLMQQYDAIGFPSVNEYLHQHAEDESNRISCIILVSLLFESGHLQEYDNFLDYLVFNLRNSRGIPRYLVLEALESIIIAVDGSLLFRKLLEEMLATFSMIEVDEEFVQIKFLKCIAAVGQTSHKISYPEEIVPIILEYVQYEDILVEENVVRIAGLLARDYPQTTTMLQPMMLPVEETYFETITLFDEARNDPAYVELLSAYLEEIVVLDAVIGPHNSQIVQSIFEFLKYEHIDQIHAFVEALIVALCEIIRHHAGELSSEEIGRAVEVFLEVLRIPIFENQVQQSFDDTETCNNFVISTKELIFDGLTELFVRIPGQMTEFVATVVQTIDAFGYAKEYEFINVCRLYTAVCGADPSVIQYVMDIFDIAMHNTHRTAFEMENLLRAFKGLLSMSKNEPQMMERILGFVLSLFSMVSRSTEKHLEFFEPDGREESTTTQYLHQIYEHSKLALELLCEMAECDRGIVEQLSDHLLEEQEDYLFMGCILQVLLKYGVDISGFLPIVLRQIEFQHNIDMDYLLLVHLYLANAFEPSSDTVNALFEKRAVNPSYCGSLLCLLCSNAEMDPACLDIIRQLTVEFEDDFEKAELVIYYRLSLRGFEIQEAFNEKRVVERVLELCERFEEAQNEQFCSFVSCLRSVAEDSLHSGNSL